MRKLNPPKAQYVDVSYGWQSRGDLLRLNRRRHKRLRWVLTTVGIIAVLGLYRWLS